jgi:hypothetical protein
MKRMNIIWNIVLLFLLGYIILQCYICNNQLIEGMENNDSDSSKDGNNATYNDYDKENKNAYYLALKNASNISYLKNEMDGFREIKKNVEQLSLNVKENSSNLTEIVKQISQVSTSLSQPSSSSTNVEKSSQMLEKGKNKASALTQSGINKAKALTQPVSQYISHNKTLTDGEKKVHDTMNKVSSNMNDLKGEATNTWNNFKNEF